MVEVKKYRRVEDGLTVSAIQYDLPHRRINQDAVSTIARFVLNMDVNRVTTVSNEHILDVVRPVPDRWNPLEGVATISIVDPRTGHSLWVELFDWLCRTSDGDLMVVNPAEFNQKYTEILPKKVRTEVEELRSVIKSIIGPLDGQVYQNLADDLAKGIMRAGWSRSGKA